MAKNEQSREVNQPVWFDGKSINEALFCDDFLGRHKIIYTNGAFFSPDGRVTNDLPYAAKSSTSFAAVRSATFPQDQQYRGADEAGGAGGGLSTGD